MVQQDPLIKHLRDNYYVEDGKLKRRYTRTRWKADEEVGTYVSKRGYKTIMVLGKRYYVHRVIFAIINGYFPDLLDHKSGNKIANDPDNLRESDKVGNALNLSGPHKDNQTGFLGVTFRKDTKKYVGQFRGKSLGCFKTPEEAQLAYVNARANEGIATRGAVVSIQTT